MHALRYQVLIGHEIIGIICRVLPTESAPCKRTLDFGQGKGNQSIICAILGASLVATVETRDRQRRAESQIIQSLQALVQSLQGQVENLKGQLEQKKAQADYLQSALKEQLLMGESCDSHLPLRGKLYTPARSWKRRN